MSDEVKPRVWVGDSLTIDHWYWTIFDGEKKWQQMSPRYSLMTGNVFVPGSEPRPTIDPSKMKTLETCDKVDWNDE